MSLFVCGDTHGDIDFHKLNTKNFDPTGLTKNDYVLVCGDFGVVWDGDGYDAYMQNWYNKKPWTTLFVDGNHENHALLDSYPVEEWNGGLVHKISDSIIHLMRGQVYTIDGRKIFTMGGASSHDKAYRKENISWWAREVPSDEEFETALNNLKANDNKVDYIFSHCASSYVQNALCPWYTKDKLVNFFDVIEDIDFGHWYCGHYHEDRDIDEKHTVLYDYVDKLW